MHVLLAPAHVQPPPHCPYSSMWRVQAFLAVCVFVCVCVCVAGVVRCCVLSGWLKKERRRPANQTDPSHRPPRPHPPPPKQTLTIGRRDRRQGAQQEHRNDRRLHFVECACVGQREGVTQRMRPLLLRSRCRTRLGRERSPHSRRRWPVGSECSCVGLGVSLAEARRSGLLHLAHHWRHARPTRGAHLL